MNKKVSKALVATLVLGTMVPATFASAASFTDINNSYAKDAITRLAELGVINGKDETHFDPQGAVTRAEFVKILVRSLNLPTSTHSASFTDTQGHWASNFIETAIEAGIIQGVGDGKFEPNGIVNREQAATMLVRALQTKGLESNGTSTNFSDFDQISDWAKPFIELAQKYNLVKGDGVNFNPKQNATREQAVILTENILRALDQLKKEYKITPENVTMNVGESKEFKVNGGGTYNTVAWSVSGNGTIDQNGKFTATSVGTATISALIDGAKTVTSSVTINAVVTPPSGGNGGGGGVELPTQLAKAVSFDDTDEDATEISGVVTWTKATDESNITGYVVYFLDNDGTQIEQIGTLAKGSTYSVTIPTNKKIPTAATKIGVFSKNSKGLSKASESVMIKDAITQEVDTDQELTDALANVKITTVRLKDNANFTGQYTIKRNVNVMGNGNKLEATDTMVKNDKGHTSVITVSDGAMVNIDHITVDGLGKGQNTADFMGIDFENAGGALNKVDVNNMRNGAQINGMQEGIGIYTENTDSKPRTITVSGSHLSGYQKGGMVFKGKGLTVDVSGNQVTGEGATSAIAQNGIQLSDGATGKIQDNHVTGHQYTLDRWGATGILVWQAGEGYVVDGNTFGDDNDTNVYMDITSELSAPKLSILKSTQQQGVISGTTVKGETLTLTSSNNNIVIPDANTPFGLIAQKGGITDVAVTLTNNIDQKVIREGYIKVGVDVLHENKQSNPVSGIGVGFNFGVVETTTKYRLMIKPNSNKDSKQNPLADLRINIVGKGHDATDVDSFIYAAHAISDEYKAGMGTYQELTLEDGWYVLEVDKADYPDGFGYIAATSVKTAGGTQINWMHNKTGDTDFSVGDFIAVTTTIPSAQ